MRLRRLLPVLVVTIVCAVPAAAGAVTFGAAVQGDFTRGWTPIQVQASLTALHATGSTVAQTSSDWAATEPKQPVNGRHRFNWSYDDEIVTDLAEAHLRWEPTLDYTPKWAQQHIKPARSGKLVSPLPPANDADYAAYATAFAGRYGVGGSFWRTHRKLPNEAVRTYEIWNEPDDKWTWGPDVNLHNYALLYAAAYTAIRRVDRHAVIVTAGLAFPASSTDRLLKAFKGIPVSAFGVHAYGSTPKRTIARVAWTGDQLADFGRAGTPMIVNEFGWTAQRHAFQSAPNRQLVDGWVAQAIAGIAQIKDVSEVIPFEWTDPQWGLSTGGLAAGIKRAKRAHTG